MKGKKTNPKLKAKLIEKKINTLKDTKEIAQEIGIEERTAQRIIKNNLSEVVGESTAIANLIDRNNNLQSLADNLLKELIENKDAKVWELVQVKKVAWEQNQVLSWKPTTRVDINWYDMLQDIQSWKINESNAYEVFRNYKELTK